MEQRTKPLKAGRLFQPEAGKRKAEGFLQESGLGSLRGPAAALRVTWKGRVSHTELGEGDRLAELAKKRAGEYFSPAYTTCGYRDRRECHLVDRGRHVVCHNEAGRNIVNIVP